MRGFSEKKFIPKTVPFVEMEKPFQSLGSSENLQ
jgi:hypothetical protein